MFNVYLKQNFPFSTCPRVVQLEGDKINVNDLMLPWDKYNPCRIRAWCIGHEFGPICVIFASHEQDALDGAVDAGLLDCLMAENQDYDDENLTPLGNASEMFDLSHAWIGEVEFDPARDIELIVAMVRANAEGADYVER